MMWAIGFVPVLGGLRSDPVTIILGFVGWGLLLIYWIRVAK